MRIIHYTYIFSRHRAKFRKFELSCKVWDYGELSFVLCVFLCLKSFHNEYAQLLLSGEKSIFLFGKI